MAFAGFVPLGSNVLIGVVCTNASNVPTNADSGGAPTCNIYEGDQDSPLLSNVALTALGPTGVYTVSQPILSDNGFASSGVYYYQGTYVVGTVTYSFDGYFNVC